jgi:hypothetical protein
MTDMEDTSGFYKLDGVLLFGPNFVLNASYELRRETHEQHTYPVDGWYWFDSEAEARAFFGLPDATELVG